MLLVEALLAQLAVASVPRECHRKQELRRGYRGVSHSYRRVDLRRTNFVMQGPASLVMSPVRLLTDLAQVYFFVRPYISPVKVGETLPCSLHMEPWPLPYNKVLPPADVSASDLPWPRDMVTDNAEPMVPAMAVIGQTTQWWLLQGTHSSFWQESVSWKDTFEFLPFSIFWKKLKAAPRSPRVRGPWLTFGLFAPHNESF